MAKKKVVKHSSHAKSKQPKKTQKKAAKIEQIIEVPQQVEEHIETPKTQEAVITPVHEIATGKDSIFADDAPKEPKPESMNNAIRLKSLAIVICVIIIILWLMIMIAAIQHNKAVEIAEHNVTSYEYVDAKLNLAEYTNITNFRYTEKVNLVGYLRLERVQTDTTTKVDTRYIVDDYGNKIALILGYNSKYEPLFINNYTTDKTFQVQGTFKYTYGGQRNLFLIEVSSITPVAKPKVNTAVTHVEYENVTVNDGYSFNLSKGWNRLTGR